jgi:hypothetical protein
MCYYWASKEQKMGAADRFMDNQITFDFVPRLSDCNNVSSDAVRCYEWEFSASDPP